MVKYLYNNKKAPILPYEWNRKIHPYATMCRLSTDGSAYLILSTAPLRLGDTSNNFLYATADGSLIVYYFDGTDYEAGFVRDESFDRTFKADEEAISFSTAHYPVWTNYDFMAADGTVYLAASEAILVVNYNGNEYPDINTVWIDKEAYTGATIYVSTSYATILHLYREPDYISTATTYYSYGPYLNYKLTNGRWVYSSGEDSTNSWYYTEYKYIRWASHVWYDVHDKIVFGPKVHSLKLTGVPSAVNTGSQVTLGVDITCDEGADETYSVAISGNASASASYTIDGDKLHLTISEAATAGYIILRVTANSPQDPAIFDEVVICINLGKNPIVDDKTYCPISFRLGISVGFMLENNIHDYIPSGTTNTVVASLTDGVLYIEKAPAVLTGNILEVD